MTISTESRPELYVDVKLVKIECDVHFKVPERARGEHADFKFKTEYMRLM